MRKNKYKALVQILYMTKDMSPAELHRKVGKTRISYSTLCAWKKGRVLYPKHDTMDIVLRAFGKQFAIVDIQDKKQKEDKIYSNLSF